MKKRMGIALILVVVLCLGLFTACGGTNDPESAREQEESSASYGDLESELSVSGPEDFSENDPGSEGTAESEEDDEYAIMTLPLRVWLSVEDVTDGAVTVLIDNQSGYEFTYGQYFSLEKEENGEWITLEPEEDLMFQDIMYILPDLEHAEVTYDLTAFGELENGIYRIEIEGLYAEFTIGE